MFTPPESERGRDPWRTPSNPQLKCPEHIVCSGSSWFCTKCGEWDYAHYEHGVKEMLEFIKLHRRCIVDTPVE